MSLLAIEVWLDLHTILAAETVNFSDWLRKSMLLKSAIPAVCLSFSLVYARGNSFGYLQRWNWILVAALLLPVGLVLEFPGSFFKAAETGDGMPIRLLSAGKAWVISSLMITLLTLINLEKTFRASVGMARWRVKYLILGMALILGVRLYSLSQMLLFSGYAPELAKLTQSSLLLGCGLIGIGQVRACFGTFDIYPSGTVIHGSITLILAGAYFVIIGLLAQWVAKLGDISSFPMQTFVLLLGSLGLAVIILSERLRTGFRCFINRHFRRPEHDFRKIWTELTRRTSSVLESSNLGKNATEVVAENFHVLGVSIFRAGTNTHEFELLHSTEGSGTTIRLEITPSGVGFLVKHPLPSNLEKSSEPWAALLREYCPKKFANGGDRLLVPLVAAERLLGLLILADRVNGTPYSHEELDLLKCIGDQLAGALLNRLLTDEVLQARELEAFQTLSTFFVHDLKNAASGLGLMLQNFPAHFDDPQFRIDAIRGLGRTAERINQLIQKLGGLRRELQLHPQPCRLDDLCAEVLDSSNSCNRDSNHLVRDLQPVPVQSLDTEAMRSVVTNLVTNAHEASNGDGVVKVATRCEGEQVAVMVADNGCGMSSDFVKSRLFRPFYTTKGKGLGIGMFQCKKIIEAHGGSISVESEPGNGTRFTILLPVTPHQPTEKDSP